MHFIAAGDDLRPSQPFSTVAGVPHDFWSTHPDVGSKTVTNACSAFSPRPVAVSGSDTSP
jgi:proline iminopeptidase